MARTQVIGDDTEVTEQNILAHMGLVEQRVTELLKLHALARHSEGAEVRADVARALGMCVRPATPAASNAQGIPFFCVLCVCVLRLLGGVELKSVGSSCARHFSAAQLYLQLLALNSTPFRTLVLNV